MDESDRNILIAVQQDGASGLSDLSKVAGLSVSATAERLKRLEERGSILGWHASLNPVAVGCPLLAHVLVSIRPGRDDAAFRKAMRKAEAVLECHATSGRWNYLIKLRVPDLASLNAFVAEEIRSHTGVERTDVMVALGTEKETMILPVAPADEE